MSNNEQPKIAMLDTSFLIRLLKEDDPLHASAKAYYQHFLENDFVLCVSTVAVAEYRVRGELDQLPFECVRVIPFNLDHAEKAGAYAYFSYLQIKIILDSNCQSATSRPLTVLLLGKRLRDAVDGV